VIGSGIDLTSQLLAGARIDVAASANLAGRSGPPWKPGATVLEDPTGTGTVMAALVALYAPAAQIMVLRVQDPPDYTTPYWHAMQVAQAIDLGVEGGADVIVVGVDFATDFPFLREAVTRAYDSNVVIVAPILDLPGATLERPSHFPADYNTTIAVAGLLPDGGGAAQPWPGSGSSHFASVAAPATLQVAGDGAAAPAPRAAWAPAIAGGVVALIASRIQPLEGELQGQYFQRIYEVLTRSANPGRAGSGGFTSQVGYGAIDAAEAVGPATEAYLAKMRQIEEHIAVRTKEVNEREKKDQTKDQDKDKP
jgi:hypothetical protein